MDGYIFIILSSLTWWNILTHSPLVLVINNKVRRKHFQYIEDLIESLEKDKKLIGYWLSCHWCGGTWLVLINYILYQYIPWFCEWFTLVGCFVLLKLTIEKLSELNPKQGE